MGTSLSIAGSPLKELSISGISLKSLSIGGVLVWEKVSFVNQVLISVDLDGKTIFNGTGYQNNMRVRSGGALGSYTGFVATGLIPVKAGDVIRFTGVNFAYAEAGNAINFGYLSNGAYTSIGAHTTQPAAYGIYLESGKTNSDNIPSKESTSIWKLTVPNDNSIKYFRMSGMGIGADLIVTVNEELIL